MSFDVSWGDLVDSGNYAVNARNKVLTGRWGGDEWMLMYLNPVPHLLTYAVYRMVGLGYKQTQLVAALLSGFTLLVVFLIFSRSYGFFWGILALWILGILYLHWTYARIANRTDELIFFLVLTFYLWLVGLERPRFLVGAGVASSLAYMTKGLSHPFTLALVVATVWVTVYREGYSLRMIWRKLRWLMVGLFIGYGFWFVVIYLPHREVFAMFFGWDWQLRRPKSLYHLFRLFVESPGFSYFLRYAPFMTLMAMVHVVAFPFKKKELVARYPVEVLAFIWFVFEYVAFSVIAYRYLRFWMPAFMGLMFMSICSLHSLWDASK